MVKNKSFWANDDVVPQNETQLDLKFFKMFILLLIFTKNGQKDVIFCQKWLYMMTKHTVAWLFFNVTNNNGNRFFFTILAYSYFLVFVRNCQKDVICHTSKGWGSESESKNMIQKWKIKSKPKFCQVFAWFLACGGLSGYNKYKYDLFYFRLK